MTPKRLSLDRARPADCPELTALIRASKAVWGYDEDFMAAARRVMIYRPKDLLSGHHAVLRLDGRPIAVASLQAHGNRQGVIETCFVAPEWLRRGLGALLMADLLGAARRMRLQRLYLDTDPFARPFYERHGFRFAHWVPSDAGIAGRRLARLSRACGGRHRAASASAR